MRIALVHDDLVQWGGAERTFYHLTQIFPEAAIFTSLYNKQNPLLTEYFAKKDIKTSFLQKVPGWRMLYKFLLPLYPIAFEQFDFSEFDVVISSTTRFAKSIITKPQTRHICYCHTPPRFLWGNKKILGGEWFKRYDLVSAKRVDDWIAGSKNAQQKIKDIYGVDSTVIYPPVDIEKLKDVEPFDGGYLLVVTRLNKYKRVDLAVKAANQLNIPLQVVGVGPEYDNLYRLAGPSVQLLGLVDENLLVKLLAGCRALLVCGEEDFGLTPLEAQALGKPVIAYKKGGVLESIIDGVTGFLFNEASISGIKEALDRLDKLGYDTIKCKEQARKFSVSVFRENFRQVVKL
ncbi:hypothetical protein A3H85_00820 [Candidatus Daviesbacteria bacterium RIFCSPLOWO2_02_FULL_40_8]|uniref:Glycosyl transferase family 1 domain-containing protein n=1 Tax=Candidatus Daviesbacteria bacterium RIFCSPLOWO2_01_FULL_40_24 TaxID=1797787 RepID=A0A1F5MJ79_9BACT|nr:MAG: hypothetical protein A3C32_04115 [Candidatus Daviesbacteria bacterium RIFCSPHIGHO2_02_FULL_41_14]OGE65412.1 MAG: hypothetical protein A3B49_00810 [Candidatus Daviesbacteria bacterium RIFCSPLOWO2_01_FULL_40_24]OGE66975.1 MAG: hypothetical protein A3H85_00820 [Candidatus Daviesbacteria bacterium RIFCSPLOWO2_02_FULL_40_8]